MAEHDLPSDRRYLAELVERKHAEARESKNPAFGDHIKDDGWEGKLTSDPTAGSGEGLPCVPQKPEQI